MTDGKDIARDILWTEGYVRFGLLFTFFLGGFLLTLDLLNWFSLSDFGHYFMVNL